MRRFGDRRSVVGFCLAILIVFLLPGCSRAKLAIKLHRISGTLQRDGKPVPNLMVHFVPEKGGPSTGVAGPDGTFTLDYQKDRPGAVPGVHKVWVEYRPKSPQDDVEMREGRLKLADDQREVIEKYGSLETTTLKVTIDGDKKDLLISLD